MKVLHFIWSANFGGIEKLVITLARQQQQNKDLQTALLVGNRKGNFLQMIEKTGLPCEFAGLKTGFDFSPRKFKRVRLRMSSFDIIHLHTFNPLVAYAAIKSGKKIVFTVHGNFGFGRKRRLTDRLLQFLCGYFLRNYVDHVTYNSEFSRQYAFNFYNLKNTKSLDETLIYNAIPNKEPELSSVKKDESFIKGKFDFIVGTASRFAGFKRIDRLIEAFAVFCKDKPDSLLLLTGDGVKMNELKELTRKKEIEKQVYFSGYQENILEWLNKMDVCVFPSEKEPFGIVALEALSLGKPVLVFSDGGGLTEIIKPLNPLNIAGNTAQMVDRLNFYYTDRKALDDEKERNRNYVLRFDMKSNEQAYYNVYRQVLKSNER